MEEEEEEEEEEEVVEEEEEWSGTGANCSGRSDRRSVVDSESKRLLSCVVKRSSFHPFAILNNSNNVRID